MVLAISHLKVSSATPTNSSKTKPNKLNRNKNFYTTFSFKKWPLKSKETKFKNLKIKTMSCTKNNSKDDSNSKNRPLPEDSKCSKTSIDNKSKDKSEKSMNSKNKSRK